MGHLVSAEEVRTDPEKICRAGPPLPKCRTRAVGRASYCNGGLILCANVLELCLPQCPQSEQFASPLSIAREMHMRQVKSVEFERRERTSVIYCIHCCTDLQSTSDQSLLRARHQRR